MPIRPENQPLYPPNWRAISIGIRQGRAGGRCEQCGIPNAVWRNHRTDMPHHRRTVHATRRTRYVLGDLFDVALES